MQHLRMAGELNQSTYTQNQTNATMEKWELKFCYNALVWRLILTNYQSYAIAICILLVSISTVLINVALFLGLIKTKQPKNNSTVYTKISAISGFVSGLTGQPLYILLFTVYSDKRNCWLEMVAIFTMQFNTHVLGYTILLLAIDRYFHVRVTTGKWALGVSKTLTSKLGSYSQLVTAFLLSILHGLTSTYFFGFKKVYALNITVIVINFIIAIGVYASYLCLYRNIRKHVKQTASVLSSVENSPRITGTTVPRKKSTYFDEFTKTISMILVASILCYLPFFVMDFWTGWYTLILKIAAPQKLRFVYYLSAVPIMFYSTVNGFLLLVKNPKALKFVLGRKLNSNVRSSVAASISNKHHHQTTLPLGKLVHSREMANNSK